MHAAFRIVRVYDFIANDEGSNKKCYKIMGVLVFGSLDKAKSRTQNTRGLNLGAVRIRNVQMAVNAIIETAK